jgi:hypothetical protein
MLRKTIIGIVVSICFGSAQAVAAELTEEQARITAAWWVQGTLFEQSQEGADAVWDKYRRSPNLPYGKMLNSKTRELLGHIQQALLVGRRDTGYCGKIQEPTWVIIGYKEFSDLNGGYPVMINARTGKVIDCRS